MSDWSTSFKGLSERPFSKETADLLLAPLKAQDVEIKPGEQFFLATLITTLIDLQMGCCTSLRSSIVEY